MTLVMGFSVEVPSGLDVTDDVSGAAPPARPGFGSRAGRLARGEGGAAWYCREVVDHQRVSREWSSMLSVTVTPIGVDLEAVVSPLTAP